MVLQDQMYLDDWAVAEEGYEIVQLPWRIPGLHWSDGPARRAQSMLVPVAGADARYKPVNLRDEPALFRIFAELPTALAEEGETNVTGERIIAFANQYGKLGGSLSAFVDVPEAARPYEGDLIFGWLNRRGWLETIAEMRAAVELWDCLAAGNEARLREWIHEEHGSLVYHGPTAQGIIINRDTIRRTGWDGDVTRAAWLQLAKMVDRGLYDRAWDDPDPVAARMVFDRDADRPRIAHTPMSLRGAMWLQLARSIEGNISYARCIEETCRKWFAVATNINRADRLYCSRKCKMRAYRRRRAEAESAGALDAGTGHA